MTPEAWAFVAVAVAAPLFALLGVWYTGRTSEVISTEDRIDRKTEAHLARIERALAHQEERTEQQEHHIEVQYAAIEELQERVGFLEEERKQMISWMAFNQLSWPPPDGWEMWTPPGPPEPTP